MANPHKIVVLDLGMQSIRMAEFSSTQDGLLKLLRGASVSVERPNQWALISALLLLIGVVTARWSARQGLDPKRLAESLRADW